LLSSARLPAQHNYAIQKRTFKTDTMLHSL
jgi:hypothetical protein